MKNRINIIMLLLSVMMFAFSCYKEDAIVTELGKPNYTIEDSSDPFDHYRYLVNQKTGIYILYDYNEVDYLWDMASLSNNRLVKQSDKSILAAAIPYLEQTLLNYYDDSFKKKYFPLKILIADSVNNYFGSELFKNRISYYGRSYLAIGRINERTPQLDDAAILQSKGDINGVLWAFIIANNDLIKIAESFFASSREFYGLSFSNDPNKADAAYLRSKGFWQYDEYNQANEFMAPDQWKDLYDFISRITSHTAEEMKALLKGNETLIVKYDALVNGLKTDYGIDLQAIGNAKIKK